ncbi:MAG: PIG-L family deacetylase [Chloroflexota bacterium]|nr:MAG: PIG-L family deacetylase [Chloroflexota bacterium]
MTLLADRVLVLAPHTDDGEIGCGGSIARFVENQSQVFYVAFSTARTSVRPEFPDNILEVEVSEATKVLGIPSENLILFDFPVRQFPKHRQEILQAMVDLRQELAPDLVLVPSLNDIHQDHQVVAAEGLRAYKRHTVLGYEEPWNNIVFETKCFIALEERHVAKKIEALHCYKSQAHRAYLDEEFMWSLARTRGTQIEGRFAEAFEVLRLVAD